jgi:hypothetical protein
MAESQDAKLPPDLLHLLCAELADQLDFSTLYRCAISSKYFAAAGALSNLYKSVTSPMLTIQIANNTQDMP